MFPRIGFLTSPATRRAPLISSLASHAAWQSAWAMPSRSAGRSFMVSAECRDVIKPCSAQNWRRTAARVSAKVGRSLRYQAVAETRRRAWRSSRVASKATIENSASRQGVVRAIALSDHWRWVSTPRWSREPPLAAEPGDPEDAGHGALARYQDGPDQQHLGVP